jgi:hypothetical protein
MEKMQSTYGLLNFLENLKARKLKDNIGMDTTEIAPGGVKNGRCLGLTILSPSCANCLETLGASTSWCPKGISRLVMG